MNTRILLVKIQGHSDILDNDISDREATLVANQITEGNIVSQAYCLSVKLTKCQTECHQILFINLGNDTGTMKPQVDTPII